MNNFHVAVRIRPINERETKSQLYTAWQFQGDQTIAQCSCDGRLIPSSVFKFGIFLANPDRIYRDHCRTREIFDNLVGRIVLEAMDGINGTVFAYGQTSSGKTFTMQGTDTEPGIIPLGISQVFNHIRNTPEREFLVRVSYIEIYNEIITDLLSPSNSNLKIHEHPHRGIFVGNLSEEIVLNEAEVMGLLQKGEEHRHIGHTNMNEYSSRSHTIFRLVVESMEREKDSRSSYTGAIKVSALSFVDLAGSERAGLTGAEGLRLKEGGHINKSLLSLSTVIQKLADGGDKHHIPYRDSKLTRILQPSLGGNSITAVICNITLASTFVEETLGTLKFASRAKTIKNKPEINQILSDEAILKRYESEIKTLKQQIEDMRVAERNQDPEVTLNTTAREQKYLQEKLEALQQMILNSALSVEKPSSKSSRRKTWFAGIASADHDFSAAPLALDDSVSKRIKISENRILLQDEQQKLQDEQHKLQEQQQKINAVMREGIREISHELKRLRGTIELLEVDVKFDVGELKSLVEAKKEQMMHKQSFLNEEMKSMELLYDQDVKDLENQVSSLKSLIENKEAQALSERLEAKQAQQESDEMMIELTGKLSSLKQKNDALLEQVRTLEEALASSEKDDMINFLMEQCEKKDIEIGKSVNDIKKAQEEMVFLGNSSQTAKEANMELLRSLVVRVEKVERSFDVEAESIYNWASDCDGRIATAIENVREATAAERNGRLQLRTKLAKYEEQILSLEQSNAQVSSLHDRLAEKERELDRIRDEAEQETAMLKLELTTNVGNCEAEIFKLHERILEMESGSQRKLSEISEVQEQLKEADEKISLLERMLETSGSEAQEQLKEKKEILAKLEQLTSEKAELEKKLSENAEAMEKQQELSRNALISIRALEMQAEQYRTTVDELKNDISEYQRGQEEYERTVGKRDDIIKELQATMEAKKGEIEAQIGELERVRQKSAEEAKERISELEREVVRLKEELLEGTEDARQKVLERERQTMMEKKRHEDERRDLLERIGELQTVNKAIEERLAESKQREEAIEGERERLSGVIERNRQVLELGAKVEQKIEVLKEQHAREKQELLASLSSSGTPKRIGKKEAQLLIELEKLAESSSRERKLASLKVSEMEENETLYVERIKELEKRVQELEDEQQKLKQATVDASHLRSSMADQGMQNRDLHDSLRAEMEEVIKENESLKREVKSLMILKANEATRSKHMALELQQKTSENLQLREQLARKAKMPATIFEEEEKENELVQRKSVVVSKKEDRKVDNEQCKTQ